MHDIAADRVEYQGATLDGSAPGPVSGVGRDGYGRARGLAREMSPAVSVARVSSGAAVVTVGAPHPEKEKQP